MIKAWTMEADEVNIGDLEPERIHEYIVVTPDVREFLQHGSVDDKLFIVAPKGLGKTLLLRAKSQLYRNRASGYAFIPETELVEKLTTQRARFSKRELEKFTTRDIWAKTWELSLLTLILANFHPSVLPRQVVDLIGRSTRLPDILGNFLNNRGNIEKLYALVPKILRPEVRDIQLREGVNQIAIFIDNIDESFDEHQGYSLRAPAASGLSDKVWINAQLAVMSVARDLCAANSHIKIFVSVRAEAFNNSDSALDLQTLQYTTKLKYTKDILKEIFERNILATDRRNLARPDAADHLKRFVGFSSMKHRFALDPNNNPREENLFDYIYRHTFGRPREIITMGYELSKVTANRPTAAQVCDLVNDVSGSLLQQYKKEIVPYFRDEVFDAFCDLVDSNTIANDKAEEIAELIADEFNLTEPLQYYYRLGLLGITAEDEYRTKSYKQRFLPVGEYTIGGRKEFPRFPKYMVLHPAIDETLKLKHGNTFYNRDNIIGLDYPFYPPTRKAKKPCHVHFGLNRDSLSLVIPELSKVKCLAVVQNPHPEYSDLGSAGTLVLETSNNEVVEFNVIHDKTDSSEVDSLLAAWRNGELNLVLYTSNSSGLHDVLEACRTLTSVSVDDSLAKALPHFRPATKRDPSYLYICQRFIRKDDMTLVREHFQQDRIKGCRVVATLLDRLSFEEKWSASAGKVKVSVRAEEFGRIICRNREGAAMQPNRTVIRTESAKEQAYYENFQKVIVEATYRFMKLLRRRRSDIEEDLYSLFFDIHIQRLLSLTSRGTLSRIFNSRTESGIIEKLSSAGFRTKERFERLDKFYRFRPETNYVRNAKREGIFPRDSEFYQYARSSHLFLNSGLVLELKRLLEVQKRRNFFSVFISYSYKDSAFASKLHDSLSKRGVDAFLFEKDDPNRPLKSIMMGTIRKFHRLLFIATEHSVRSPNCQFELTQGREKLAKEWGRVFVPIRLDDFILKVERHEVGDAEKRDEYWANILEILRTNITDFSDFSGEEISREYEEMVDSLVADALRKKRRK